MTAELDKVIDAEIVDGTAPLSPNAAKNLNADIKVACEHFTTSREHLQDLLEQAYDGKIDVALGYPSWTKWFSENVTITPTDRAERQAWAAAMSGKGMSQRAIAEVLGCDQKTVSNDLRTEENSSVEPDAKVTSLNGSRRPKHPKPKAKARNDIDQLVDLDKKIDKADAEAARSLNDVRQNIAKTVHNLGDMFVSMPKVFNKRIGDALAGLIEEVAPKLTETQRNQIAKAVMAVDADA
jgi:predicted transcriptional regulator